MRLNEALDKLADLQHLHRSQGSEQKQQAIIQELTGNGYPVSFSDEVDTYLPGSSESQKQAESEQ